ncbi:hypothetical protein [Roseomonas indoligenes]|uniref:DUF2783 domain-containing protein n=1 Tax=Roseomonas indoligenes TaxID=2820811 RepID=A0A940S7A0_9PROT|nr:hypothetical protein [Pararoseomonas indoligenes]MBP0496406.1 hypothetical protein [Pararoseomonas indoligenes]
MHAEDLDRSYTALCQALERVGEGKAPLLLAMVSLALIARQASAEDVLPLIAQAAASIGEGPTPE